MSEGTSSNDFNRLLPNFKKEKKESSSNFIHSNVIIMPWNRSISRLHMSNYLVSLFSIELVGRAVVILLFSLHHISILNFLPLKLILCRNCCDKKGNKGAPLQVNFPYSTFVNGNYLNVPENHNHLQGNSSFSCISRKNCLLKGYTLFPWGELYYSPL